ncbi:MULTISPECIES: hypothetical protein [unclassified Rickettsia]
MLYVIPARHCCVDQKLIKPVMAKPRSGCGHPGYPEYNEGFN